MNFTMISALKADLVSWKESRLWRVIEIGGRHSCYRMYFYGWFFLFPSNTCTWFCCFVKGKQFCASSILLPQLQHLATPTTLHFLHFGLSNLAVNFVYKNDMYIQLFHVHIFKCISHLPFKLENLVFLTLSQRHQTFFLLETLKIMTQ